MALIKSVLLISSSLSVSACLTPPSVPNDGERVKVGLLEKIGINIAPALGKSMLILIASAETATILAARYPSLFPGGTVSALVRGSTLPSLQPDAVFTTGALLAIAGSQLRLLCFRVLGRHFTFELSVRKDHSLITLGPYSVVRHPSYAGWLIAMGGIMAAYFSPGSWLRTSGWLDTTTGRVLLGLWTVMAGYGTVSSLVRPVIEDRFLREHFREEWDRYAQRVKWRLVPGIF
ncbi:hypothetical protein CONPUDRAFT_164250 [Coniophora puteana RWD-64-598 SS2]|uniref:Protein-S-isoprenylcysteine O-methyltransferase n=1 Tax=Coniophora puteana (strain RWD-64-598) TaxID=741705 RepID=A0A5M3MW43_CONPW|nr:uncharacterized protein CONPUDRAFT_164250 [Coniophora puteana RWD-64-598 SS2]EIW83280.1 hypothetical protein CONPUDRAFT_164250 [Coniophora puteana RWD-64-598 SS2]